ncbi:MAG: toll/interleukin-1 receptor domain-containing protein [Planctomycetota bacterium]|nr:toll/interleukin-1 receptor domain-containing protein [Planctomycetota bacterium]
MTAPPHAVFVSYRIRDSSYAVDRLDERLKQAFGEHAVFRDVRSIPKGQAFPDDIRAALQEAAVGLVVVGALWLEADRSTGQRRLDDPQDWVRIEVETLLQQQTPAGQPIPVIPVLLGGERPPQAEALPDSLKPLAARNAQPLRPEPDFEDSVRQLIEHLARVLGVAPQPFGPSSPGPPEPPPRVSPSRLNVTGTQFVGREQELHLLDEAWQRTGRDKFNIVSLIGQGGEGKTALVLNWVSRRSRHGWQGARRVFDWSFYSQGSSDQSSASADEFFSAAFAWFGHVGEVPKDPWTKGGRLAELIAAERTLLVLDGLEPLQQPPSSGFGGEFKDPAMKALLRGLALHNPGLCLLTSRADITDLATYEHADGSCLHHPLDALDPAAARALLRRLGVLGPDRELDEAIDWFHRHAYDLNLLGYYLGNCTTDLDIRGWRERFPILKEDERIHPVADASGKRAGHGRRMLRAYERWLTQSSSLAPVGPRKQTSSLAPVPRGDGRGEGPIPGDGPDIGKASVAVLRLLGLFDRPVRSDLLDELRADPVIPGLTESLVSLPDDDWLATLDQLQQLSLISRQPLSLPAGESRSRSRETSDRTLTSSATSGQAARPRRAVSYVLDCHPLLREHFAADLRAVNGKALAAGSATAGLATPGPAAGARPATPAASALPLTEGAICDAWRAGHRRVYEYLCATTPDKPQPTLEDLQPLYQALAHGCQAGLQQEACDNVYFARIARADEAYAVRKLGAFGSELGAVACFFDPPWSRVSPSLAEADQAWLLNQAAFRLRALGRLTEALEPRRAGLQMRIQHENWIEAAKSASNLSELELTLGEVAGAVRDAEQSVTFADRSGDAFLQLYSRTTHADVLHQAGRRAEAEALFREAEALQAESQPDYPLLYSLRGFRYCDLLLADAERAAWLATLECGDLSPLSFSRSARVSDPAETHDRRSPDGSPVAGDLRSEPVARSETGHNAPRHRASETLGRGEKESGDKSPHSKVCRAVSERATQTLKWAEQHFGLLDNALDHLTLGRAALYAAILQGSQISNFEFDQAVSGLRRAGQLDELPKALLSRAWQRFLSGVCTGPDSAQSDLDEAWEIAERGPMPLFLADILLSRVRLFGRTRDKGERIREKDEGREEEQAYPWQSPEHDLAEARRLIEKHGYGRRKEELEDAENVILREP